MKKLCFLIAILAQTPLCFAQGIPAEAPGLTFSTRLNLALCPEYPFGGVSVEFKYRVGEDSNYAAADVENLAINEANNTATVELNLPSQYGRAPISVAAFCTSERGTSDPSNELSATNCDALALLDSDLDGLSNALEDTDCSNFFSPGDFSNPDNLDSDGDGFRDVFEYLDGTDPTNPGVSPRPKIFAGAPFDPDADGNANPVVWRPGPGLWFIRDYESPGNNLAIQWGLFGDTPFVYDSAASTRSDVGVIRRLGNEIIWLFHGPGFVSSSGQPLTALRFGLFGDNVIPGPWETPGVTNPAVARLFANSWTFYIYQRDGSARIVSWGGNGDVPMLQDYDGDGLFDIAVYRPPTGETFAILSSDGSVRTFRFGTPTAEFTFRGDVTGDGKDDLSFWEPINARFSTLKSDGDFDDTLGTNPSVYQELDLGLFFVHLPLPWNKQGDKVLYTVIDHATGYRAYREDNNPNNDPIAIQWGIPGDSQG